MEPGTQHFAHHSDTSLLFPFFACWTSFVLTPLLQYTLREDGESAWQSDGVQLGGPGSAAGVLGMWTSAEHEHMDPLGALLTIFSRLYC